MDKAYEDLYAKIPAFRCKAGCNHCCGPRPIFSLYELERIPEDKRKPIDAYTCPYKSDQGCQIYDFRSLTCRLYGTVEGFACEHAGPEKLLTRGEGKDLKIEYFKLYITSIKKREKKWLKEKQQNQQ